MDDYIIFINYRAVGRIRLPIYDKYCVYLFPTLCNEMPETQIYKLNVRDTELF